MDILYRYERKNCHSYVSIYLKSLDETNGFMNARNEYLQKAINDLIILEIQHANGKSQFINFILFFSF